LPFPASENVDVSSLAGWGMIAPYFSMGQRHDYTKGLSAIAAPCLILLGSKDLANKEEISATYGKIKGSQTIELPAGHFPFVEAPTEFAAQLGNFLK
jgi:pimeloyl-ACP methyl ester carboxylesterase